MDVRLIEEVSQWPILYNTTCAEYKNVDKKNAAWNHIANNLFGYSNPITVEKVKNKWKNLRDTFVKSQRKKIKPNSKPWKLEGQMSFLIPYINPKVPFPRYHEEPFNLSTERQSTSSLEDSVNDSSWQEVDFTKKNREEDDTKVDLLQHVETVMEDSPLPRNPSNTPKGKKRRKSFSNLIPPALHFLDNYEQVYDQIQNPPSYDSVDSFFLGLASSVKRMRPLNQIILKRAICNLVFDTEMKELEAANNHEATSSCK